MKVGRFREIVRMVLRSDADDYTAVDLDQAAIRALTTVIQTTKCTRRASTATLTAGNPVLDLSGISGFRQERLIAGEVAYSDEGEWATATPYAINDMVQGDGSPDALFYVCNVAHTSAAESEPPNAAYWDEVHWRRGTQLVEVSDSNLRDLYLGRQFQPGSGGGSGVGGGSTPGRPRNWAFLDPVTAYVWPSPDAAYPITVYSYAPLVSWTEGEDTDVDLNVPDEYCQAAAWLGAPAQLKAAGPDAMASSPAYQRFLQEVQQIKGEARIRPASMFRTPGNGLV